MAITVAAAPHPLQPVYEPFFFQVSSSNYNQPQFRFIFDVYKNGTYVERVKMMTQPGLNKAIFSPARIMESYLSYDIPNGTNLQQYQTNSIAHYYVKFGEEYGPVTANPVVYADLDRRSGYTWNGTVQYSNYYFATGAGYVTPHYLLNQFLNPNTGKFLTNSPTGQTIGSDDEHTLDCFNLNADVNLSTSLLKACRIYVVTSQTSGGTTASIYNFGANTGTSMTYQMGHWPAGPKNLIAMPFANKVSGAFPVINTSTDYKYTVTLMDASSTVISETREFTIEDCGKYDSVRLMWLNKLGGWDYFNFRMVSRDTVNSEKTTYKKNIPIDYYYGLVTSAREMTVVDSMVQKSKRVTSNWVTDEESVWLEELWSSPEVYEIIDDANYLGVKTPIPIVITTTTQEIKKRINDQIFNYELDYNYASQINVQRG